MPLWVGYRKKDWEEQLKIVGQIMFKSLSFIMYVILGSFWGYIFRLTLRSVQFSTYISGLIYYDAIFFQGPRDDAGRLRLLTPLYDQIQSYVSLGEPHWGGRRILPYHWSNNMCSKLRSGSYYILHITYYRYLFCTYLERVACLIMQRYLLV